MAKILVLEDEGLLREDVTLILEINGHVVYDVANGEDGLALVKDTELDLIISDIAMPYLDGFEFLTTVRHIPGASTIPVIFLTAKAEREDLRFGMELGVDDYLTKPFSTEDLLKAVNTQLKKRQMLLSCLDAYVHEVKDELLQQFPLEFHMQLNSIIGLAELLRLDSKDVLSAHQMAFVDNILDSARQIHHNLSNMLLYRQLELLPPEKRAEMDCAVCEDPVWVIKGTVRSLAEKYDRIHDVNLHATRANVAIAEHHLQKIIFELIDSVFKFSLASSPVFVTAVERDDAYVISIWDVGRGMTSSEIATLGCSRQFEREIHLSRGAELGLAMVSRLVELYGGSLLVAQRQPRGVSIMVRLPLVK